MEDGEFITEPELSWQDNIYSVTTLQEISLITGEEFSEQPHITCTTTPGRTTISYTIVANGTGPIPDWVTLNEETGKYEGTAPEVSGTETFSFKIQASWTTNPSGSSDQIVFITVGPKPPIINPVELLKNPSVVNIITQVAVGASLFLAIVKGILMGKPSTGFFLIVNFLQIVILLLMIDSFIPDKIQDYLNSLELILFTFNFIPTKDLPLLDKLDDWMGSPQPREALADLGLESRSTLLNILSLITTLFWIIIIHFICRFLIRCKPSLHPSA